MNGTITLLGHATVRLTLPDERIILIDPWLAENPACPEPLKKVSRCDMLLLTHGHFDHIGDVASIVKQHNPVVVGNLELCGVLQKQIGQGRFSGMNTGGTQMVDGVRVTLTQAFHSSAVDSPEGPLYAGMPNGVIVGAEGLASVYHAGDTDVFGDMSLIKTLFQPEICLLPIGDFFTMGAKGAALAARMLEPQAIIPLHYKTFPILDQSTDAFREALPGELKGKVYEPDVGQPLQWTIEGVGA